MRVIIIIIVLLNIYISYSQDFMNEFNKDICECFTSNKEERLDALRSCFYESLNTYESEFERFISENSASSTDESVGELAAELFRDMQTSLVHNCDAFYEMFELLRDESIINMQKKYPQSKIDTLNKKIEKNKTSQLLWERGNAYFSKGELSKAKENYKMSLELAPDSVQSIYFLGWVYEKEKKYLKAIELYEKIYKSTGELNFKIAIEMTKRKMLTQ